MFAFLATLLALGLAAAAVILVPLLVHHHRDKERTSSAGVTLGVGVAVALFMPLAGFGLYGVWSTWEFEGTPEPATAEAGGESHSLEEAVAQLEARLQQAPDDLQGWRMLGRSYISMGRFNEAADAYRRALDLAPARPPMIVAELGEALVLTQTAAGAEEAGPLIDEALAALPDDPRALWYAGLLASSKGDVEAARRHWSRLLANQQQVPEPMLRIIRERVGDLSGGAPAMAAGPGPAAPVRDAGPGEDGAIELNITLDPELQARLATPVPLFIFARAEAGGPPLAVVRRSSAELPLSVSISDANAMMEGRLLSDHAELKLVARLAVGGTPQAQPGDLYGEVNFSRDGGDRTSIFIDRVVP